MNHKDKYVIMFPLENENGPRKNIKKPQYLKKWLNKLKSILQQNKKAMYNVFNVLMVCFFTFCILRMLWTITPVYSHYSGLPLYEPPGSPLLQFFEFERFYVNASRDIDEKIQQNNAMLDDILNLQLTLVLPDRIVVYNVSTNQLLVKIIGHDLASTYDDAQPDNAPFSNAFYNAIDTIATARKNVYSDIIDESLTNVTCDCD